MVVIEQNLDAIKTVDWIIDLGPEGGDGGGEIVAQGTPEDVVKAAASLGRPVRRSSESEGGSPKGEGRSYTGEFLRPVLGREAAGRKKKGMQAAE